MSAIREHASQLRKNIAEMWRRLSLHIDALGAYYYDVGAEESFRDGVRELLREAGFSVDRWVYLDVAGYVYGFMSDVELDVLARGGSVFAAEIAAAVKRSDLVVIKRKAELYQRATGRRVDGVLAIVAYIHDKNPTMVEDMAKKMGIELIRYSNIDSIL